MTGAGEDGIGFAHATQIAHQRKHICVCHRDGIAVGNRQIKSGALKQRGGIGKLGEGRNARRNTARDRP